ncbi:exodeoxyribonuclease VII large subunit [Candidatus Kinetoplastibacterium desouzaii TCC079E]|uniref:Exodeoxyribonuclease 7 large subunit n=1 Tax=Candidatus Kinetoplastidibacterium desouzai TCC079E TaxID=1208919 RepID=M1LU75_9PROT|nr:exodeoxyribonuclease VII large subunit [Candidatus Kinetoplastibacterium desouzaii]AGF46844.1 exodeoxyribonuclease VII large subunit [Candidatus Kinetoplastibacterium desouzaii TCC079E]
MKNSFFEFDSSVKEIWTVADLNRFIGSLLDREVSYVLVKGEISNFIIATSGHWYFTLKDSHASVKVVMFKGQTSSIGFIPKDGDKVELYAKASLYIPRGDYQLQASRMRISGVGNLHEIYLLIKKRLFEEGLFDSCRKRSVNKNPSAIGVITSLKAAALNDVISSFKRRAPYVNLIIYPSPVQGEDAPIKLIEQLNIANRRKEVDTILIVRGGGSLEDLWAFNDEYLARAIGNSKIPIISGVGHDIDFTIVDFVADLRAPTPTAAAELASNSQLDMLNILQLYCNRMHKVQMKTIQTYQQRLDKLSFRISSPLNTLYSKKDKVLYLFKLLLSFVKESQSSSLQRVNLLKKSLIYKLPNISYYDDLVRSLYSRLQRSSKLLVVSKDSYLSSLVSRLNLLNHDNILLRGYALVVDKDGKIVKSSEALTNRQELEIQFYEDKLDVLVNFKDKNTSQ